MGDSVEGHSPCGGMCGGGGGAAAARTYTPLLGRATLLVPPCGRAGWPRAVAGGHNRRAGDPPPAAHGRCAAAGATRTATAARPARLFLLLFFFPVGRCWWTTWRRLLHCTPHAATAGVREAMRGGDALHLRDLDRDVLVFHTLVNHSSGRQRPPSPAGRDRGPETGTPRTTKDKRCLLTLLTQHATHYALDAIAIRHEPHATRHHDNDSTLNNRAKARQKPVRLKRSTQV